MSNQFLAEPLNAHLLKLVEMEANRDWALKKEEITIPKVTREKKVKLSEVVKYAMRQLKV